MWERIYVRNDNNKQDRNEKLNNNWIRSMLLWEYTKNGLGNATRLKIWLIVLDLDFESLWFVCSPALFRSLSLFLFSSSFFFFCSCQVTRANNTTTKTKIIFPAKGQSKLKSPKHNARIALATPFHHFELSTMKNSTIVKMHLVSSVSFYFSYMPLSHFCNFPSSLPHLQRASLREKKISDSSVPDERHIW